VEKSKFFEDKKINIILGILIGLMGAQIFTINCLSSIIPQLVIALVLILVSALLLGLFKPEFPEKSRWNYMAKYISIIAGIFLFLSVLYNSSEACIIWKPLLWIITGAAVLLVVFVIVKDYLKPKEVKEKKA